MSLAIDHVLIAASDLDASAAALLSEAGLESVPGGRHPGAGTANRIVPLGAAYLELIAVVDAEEAAANPLSRRVTAALEQGRRFATWAVRTEDLDADQRRLDEAGFATLGPAPGARARPDGVVLRWRTLHVGDGLDPALPFLIEWSSPQRDHPGFQVADHPAGTATLKTVLLAAPEPDHLRRRIGEVLGGESLAYQVSAGAGSGIEGVVLDLGGVERVLR